MGKGLSKLWTNTEGYAQIQDFYNYKENAFTRDLFLSIMDAEQLQYLSESNDEILLMLTPRQKERIQNGENIFVVLSELNLVEQEKIKQVGLSVLNTLNREQKTDLLFLSSGMLSGIDLDKRLAILEHLKVNDGTIEYDDLVSIGVYKEGDLAKGGFKRWLQNRNMGGPANFGSLLETEYRLNSFETSFAELAQEARRRKTAEMSTLFAMAAAPIVDRMLYGPGGVTFGNNVPDNLERQGTKGDYKGSAYSWKALESAAKTKITKTPELENHINNVDVNVPRSRGIGGAHNSEQFLKSDIKIVNRKPHPTVEGVEIVKYKIPKMDKTGSVMPGEYQSKTFTKTTYDPRIINSETYINRGVEAANDALSKSNNGTLPREWYGKDSQGVSWHGYYEKGVITSFYPE